MARSIGAGAAYFALIFALGLVLGTVRTLVLEPRLGAPGAVLLELPVMLAASWFVCGWLVRRLSVPARPLPRLAMGSVAFLILMAAELGLSLYAVGGSVTRHFVGYAEPARALGLAGQIAFASFPSVRLYDRRR